MWIRKQHGSALIVALFVFSLSVIVATAMTNSQSLHLRRTANLLEGDQAYLYALSLEENIKFTLLEDKKPKDQKEQQSTPPTDHLQEPWAQKIDTTDDSVGTKVELFAIATDAQACLNVNALVDTSNVPPKQDYPDMFKRLLHMHGIEENDSITSATSDWIDSDQKPIGGGAEDRDYLEQKPPYRTANQMLIHPSELRLVRGISSKLLKKIRPFICALPETSTKININTAPASVLRLLAQNISQEDAEALIAGRTRERGEGKKTQQAYETVEQFLEEAVFRTKSADKKPKKELLSVESSYFLVDATAKFVDPHTKVVRAKAHVVSLLKREKDSIRVLWRSWGE